MKKLSYLLLLLAIPFITFSNSPSSIKDVLSFDNPFPNQQTYPLTATTENPYGQNYSIGIEVVGYKVAGTSSISSVYVNGGGKVSYYPVPYTQNKYQFSYNGSTYYFTF